MSIEVSIRQIADGIPPGASVRCYCPFCEATDEKSLSVKRDSYQTHKLWFRCFRGKCGQKGMVVDAKGAYMVLHGAERPGDDERAMPQYDRPSPEFMVELEMKYETPATYLAGQTVRYDEEAKGLVMPWLDQKGHQFGWIHKQFAPGVPKNKHDAVNKNIKLRLSFPLGVAYTTLKGRGATCVLVEDLLSAYKLSWLCRQHELPIYPVSLQGARLSKADAALVATLFDNLVICLDYDQWPKGALEVLERFKPLPIRQVATTLRQDPKDTPAEELITWLPGLLEMF